MQNKLRRHANLNNGLKTKDYRIAIAGGHQLQLRRCYRDVGHKGCDDMGTPIFMLAGFLADASLFFPAEVDAGLAPFLARAGYDVFVAELRGKGKSWPSISHKWRSGLHQSIVEDIPAHLNKIAKLRPEVPQIWVGQGLGSVLLTASYARLERPAAAVAGMVHFATERYCVWRSRRQAMAYRLWRWRCTFSFLLHGYIKRGNGDNEYRESHQSALEWQRWQRSDDWVDPVDLYNYRRAMQQKGMPPTLYFAAQDEVLWGSIENCRLWIKELGKHDARLMTLGKICGNECNYTQSSMVTSADAYTDHFPELLVWLQERQVQTATAMG